MRGLLLAFALALVGACGAHAQQVTGTAPLSGDCTTAANVITCSAIGSQTPGPVIATSLQASSWSLSGALPPGTVFRAGVGLALSMSTTSDQAISLAGPASGSWVAVRMVATNCTANESAAVGAVYGSTSKGGGIILGSVSTSYPAGTGNAGAKVYTMQINASNTVYAPVYTSSAQTVYLSLTTGAASGACDIYIYGEAL